MFKKIKEFLPLIIFLSLVLILLISICISVRNECVDSEKLKEKIIQKGYNIIDVDIFLQERRCNKHGIHNSRKQFIESEILQKDFKKRLN